MKIKKGDSVKVMTGNDKNKIGRVLKVYPKKDRILVEGVNMVKKHTRPTQDNPQGGILEKESTIHISNVKLVVDGKPTRVGYKTLENGKKARVAKTTGEIIG
ncbi:MAG: 50S ribosomal protein L24 [Candidatus Marinimicrobia bacterium]|nr:50S ribosomal protein L24 [Candidatus Neomarinimicrobiota bacterium]MBL7023060.1 50S ribosomal protein L24 [Candidatus Neomarinimicrobiota bacterium]MBL7109080.1 50S ribosomal protein L24 [Candidatus Neomarinimicrobiota bacterium]